eukprot:6349987-Prymnesium_polylepis.1
MNLYLGSVSAATTFQRLFEQPDALPERESEVMLGKSRAMAAGHSGWGGGGGGGGGKQWAGMLP